MQTKEKTTTWLCTWYFNTEGMFYLTLGRTATWPWQLHDYAEGPVPTLTDGPHGNTGLQLQPDPHSSSQALQHRGLP